MTLTRRSDLSLSMPAQVYRKAMALGQRRFKDRGATQLRRPGPGSSGQMLAAPTEVR